MVMMFQTDRRPQQAVALPRPATVKVYAWSGALQQDVVAVGSPAEARTGGRIAVLQFAEALKRLAD